MQLAPNDEATAWYCLASRQKHEHIAAAQLAQHQKVKVFAPRIRFRRPTRLGPAWATEALFPSYFFARIAPSQLRRAHCAPEVRGVVHFGNSWPAVPDQVIEALENRVGGGEIRVISPEVSAGDEDRIIEGAFHGFEAVVTRVMPALERVAVLLDFLGRQTVVELGNGTIVKNAEQRAWLFKAA